MAETLADLIEARFGLPSEAGRDLPAEGAAATILRHRTHRRFTDQPISEALMEVLYACAFSAPAKSDLQQVSVIRLQDPATRAAMAALVPSMPWIGTAPVFLVFCGDNRRIRRICEMRGKPFANEHLDSFLNAATDAALTMQNMIIAAEALGLGACPISQVRNEPDKTGEILGLPDGVFPYAGLCLGYPAQKGFISLRLPPAIVVHTDQYDEANLAAEMDGYDRRRDAVYSIPPEKQKYRDEFGDAALYGWSEDKARQVSKPERDRLGAYVRAHGFSLK